MKQCMGGWCHRRNTCAHHHAPDIRGTEPVERLCAGTEFFEQANPGGNPIVPHGGDYLRAIEASFMVEAE